MSITDKDLLKFKSKILSRFDYYNDPDAREISHRAKHNDPDALLQIAYELSSSLILPHDAVIIPMPSRHGIAENNLIVAHYLSEYLSVRMLDCIKGHARDSLYNIKRNDANHHIYDNSFFGYHFENNKEPDGPCYLFDIVVGTGSTMYAASSIFKNKKPELIAYAMLDKNLLKPAIEQLNNETNCKTLDNIDIEHGAFRRLR